MGPGLFRVGNRPKHVVLLGIQAMKIAELAEDLVGFEYRYIGRVKGSLA